MEIYEYLTMSSNNNLKGEQWIKREHRHLKDTRNTKYKQKENVKKINWRSKETGQTMAHKIRGAHRWIQGVTLMVAES